MIYLYPAIRSTKRDIKFTFFIHSLCTVTDFSAGAFPIGVEFFMAVRPHLRQVLSYLVDSPRDGRIFGVNRGHMAGYASCWSTCLSIWVDR